MRAFIAVAQEGSFTAAGRRLGVSTKMISKKVAALEARLSTRLFNRTTRSVGLTEVGASFLERCRPLVEDFDELEALVRDRQAMLAGRIRVTAPTGFGSTRLVRALAPFLEQQADVTVDLRLSDNVVSVVDEGIDLAIRIGTLPDSTLIARRLSPMPGVTCASPAYLSAHGLPDRPEALGDHRCLLAGDHADNATWHFDSGAESVVVRVSGPLTANAPRALADAAIQGLGIARCPLYAVEDAFANGRLIRLLTNWETDEMWVHALYPPNRHLTARVRALIDHLAESLGAQD